MVASPGQDEAVSWPQTRCAKCQTVFEVPPELLASRDTRVRCGECLTIFDAVEGVERQKSASESSAQTQHRQRKEAARENKQIEEYDAISGLDETYADFDLFSSEADLPEVPYTEKSGNRVEFNFDSVEIDHDQTFSDTLFLNDVTINADLPIKEAELSKIKDGKAESEVTDSAAAELEKKADVAFAEVESAPESEALEFHYHDPDAVADKDENEGAPEESSNETVLADVVVDTETSNSKQRSAAGYWFVWSVTAVLVVVLIAALFLFRERHRLYNDMRVRPIYEAFCAVARCEVPLPFAPGQMGLLRRSIYPHPEVDGALVINVVIKNKASFAQRYPVLAIRLEENNGSPLATRDFIPQEYLEPHILRDSATIAAGAAVSITLEINDPGEKAGSFTLNFR